MTFDEQLHLWVTGTSTCPNEEGECCPDFSCCQPHLQAPPATRTRFAKAWADDDSDTVVAMLSMFVRATIPGAARVGGDPTNHHDEQ